jgi:hypothetical protein
MTTGTPRMITYAGKRQSVAAWARELGVSRQALHQRLARGWSIEEAVTAAKLSITHDPRPKHRTVTLCGQRYCINDDGSLTPTASLTGGDTRGHPENFPARQKDRRGKLARHFQ